MLQVAAFSAAVLAFTSFAEAGLTYNVAEKYGAEDFMDESKWNWRTSSEFENGDPTGGYINYVDLATAKSRGIAGVEDGAFRMQVDTDQGSYSDSPPNSIRIESASSWKHFVMVAKFSKFPQQNCALWPAFWANGVGEWPKSGEMNMYEAWNLDPFNRPALHTGNKAEVGSLVLKQDDMTGDLVRDDCDNVAGPNKDIGCVVYDVGEPYLSQDGGVYAVQLEDDRLRMWKWTNGKEPVALNDEHPDPDTWGTPFLSTPVGQSLDTLFQKQQIILNLDVCGGAPEATWAVSEQGEEMCSEKTGCGECRDFVKGSDGSLFDGYSFKINGITVWTTDADGSDNPSETPGTTETPESTTETPESITTSERPEETTTAEETSAEETTAEETTAEETASPEPTTAPEETTAEETSTSPEETSDCDSMEPEPTGTSSPTETGDDEECEPTSTDKTTIFSTATATETDCDEPTETGDNGSTGGDGTGSDEEDLCTSTVYITSVEVVTSCAPVVTDCTLGDTTTRTIVSTTVYPTDTATDSPEEGSGDDTTTTTATTQIDTTVAVTATASPTAEDGSGGVGGDEGADTTEEVSATATGTTLAQIGTSSVTACLSGANCPTQTPETVVVSGAGRVAVTGGLVGLVGVVALLL